MLKLEGHVLYGRYIDTSYAYHCIHLSLQFPKHQANNVAQFTLSLSFFFSLWERHWFWKHFYGSRSHSVEVILHHLYVPLLKSLFMEKNAGHSIFRRYVPLCEESSLQRRKCSYERSVSSRKVGTSETTMQVSGKRAIINCIYKAWQCTRFRFNTDLRGPHFLAPNKIMNGKINCLKYCLLDMQQNEQKLECKIWFCILGCTVSFLLSGSVHVKCTQWRYSGKYPNPQ